MEKRPRAGLFLTPRPRSLAALGMTCLYRSLLSKNAHRIHSCRATGRDIARREADGGEQQRSRNECQRVPAAYAKQEGLEKARRARGEREAHANTKNDEQHSFAQNLTQYVGASCSECHAPGAPGRTQGIEATQDWSTAANARRTLRGDASGLIGNFAGCNGAPLLGASAEQSLLVASLDDDVRANFELADHPDCTGDAISNQNMKIGEPLSGSVLQDLKDWIDAGAP